MNILDKNAQKLAELLHKSDIQQRRVVYLGIGFALAQQPMVLNNKSGMVDGTTKVKLKSLVGRINEMAIVDYDTMYKLILDAVTYKVVNNSDITNMLINSGKDDSIFLIDKFFNQADLFAMISDKDIFKNAIMYFNNWYKDQEEG